MIGPSDTVRGLSLRAGRPITDRPVRRSAAPLGAPLLAGATVACFCWLATGATLAQGPPAGSGPPVPGSSSPKDVTRAQERREAQLRSVGMITRDRKDPRFARAAAGQVKSDYEKLQELRNELVRAARAGDNRDLKGLATSATECEKRARRLRDNLAVTAVSADAQKDVSVVARPVMDVALVTLCRSIDSFVENPLFDLDTHATADDIAKATRDLDKIIRLSGGIRRGAEAMRRSPAPDRR